MNEEQEQVELVNYNDNVLRLLDSINTVQLVNMFLLCIVLGILLGGALWKHFRP